jgi:hypothetical protein
MIRDLGRACLSLKCAKAQKHLKSCPFYGQPYPKKVTKSDTKGKIKTFTIATEKDLSHYGFEYPNKKYKEPSRFAKWLLKTLYQWLCPHRRTFREKGKNICWYCGKRCRRAK